jgi:hypothetical protein
MWQSALNSLLPKDQLGMSIEIMVFDSPAAFFNFPLGTPTSNNRVVSWKLLIMPQSFSCKPNGSKTPFYL